MPLTSKGSDIALKRVDATGRFTYDMSTTGTNKGNPQLSDDRAHACLTTLFSWKRGRLPGPDQVPQGGYYLDATGRRGTLLWTVKYDRLATRSDLIACVQDAGQQLIDDKLITAFTADANRVSTGLGRWSLTFGRVLPSGEKKDVLVNI